MGFGVQPQGPPQEWGLGQRPNALRKEQGFKGLAPWCRNNHHISYYYICSQLTLHVSQFHPQEGLYNKNDVAWGGAPMGFGAAPQALRRSGVRGGARGPLQELETAKPMGVRGTSTPRVKGL